MKQYLRLIHRRNNSALSAVDQNALVALLATAAGVSQVNIVGPHPKGGYRLTCEIEEESLGNFIELLEAHGWMLVF
jgi:hypothetical protein